MPLRTGERFIPKPENTDINSIINKIRTQLSGKPEDLYTTLTSEFIYSCSKLVTRKYNESWSDETTLVSRNYYYQYRPVIETLFVDYPNYFEEIISSLTADKIDQASTFLSAWDTARSSPQSDLPAQFFTYDIQAVQNALDKLKVMKDYKEKLQGKHIQKGDTLGEIHDQAVEYLTSKPSSSNADYTRLQIGQWKLNFLKKLHGQDKELSHHRICSLFRPTKSMQRVQDVQRAFDSSIKVGHFERFSKPGHT